MGEARERWRGLVEARLAEMERLREGSGNLGGQFWDRRARQFTRGPMGSADGDPMLARLRRAVGRSGEATVLDVGSGPGRFTLAIASRARTVVAVDPSKRMLGILRRRAREAGIGNVTTVTGMWQDLEVEAADVVPFLRKLHEASRRRVLLYVGACAVDAVIDPFWRHFHGAPRRPGASYLDAVDVLEEMGIRPRLEVVELRNRSKFETLADAVEVYREQLVLPKTAAVRKELVGLLEPWLQRRNGSLVAPFRTYPAAILSWDGGATTVP